ncbi:MAG: hypothetical protein DWQ06_01455 [Calditrichaeota bacterium]|nr:MAG: hypothetical protein DWQ06_01455 [Calditrichota bacterium]
MNYAKAKPSKIGILFNNLGAIVFIILVMELIGHCVHFMSKEQWLWEEEKKVDGLYKQHPYLVGELLPNKRFEKNGLTISTTPEKTRWVGAPAVEENSIKIACVGGSTTFCPNVSDQETWSFMLQRKLGNNYSLMNYGVKGYTTVENIIQMSLLVPEFKPDVVIFYVGWSDLANYHRKDSREDYFGHGMEQFQNFGFSVDKQNVQDAILSKSGIVYLGSLLNENYEVDYSKLFLKERQKPTSEDDKSFDKIYGRNLETLKNLTLQLGAVPIFVPHVLNYDEYTSDIDSRFSTPLIVDNSVPEKMLHLNEIMLNQFDNEVKTRVVIDMIRTEWFPDHFTDEGHFSKNGNDIFSDILAEQIKKLDVRK